MTNDDRDTVPPPPFLRSIRFVADRHDWTVPFVYHLIRSGQVKAYRQGEKITVVDVASADAYAVSRPLDLAEHVPVAAIKGRAAKRAAVKVAKARAIKAKVRTSTRSRKSTAEKRSSL